jgi:hypothetical protein
MALTSGAFAGGGECLWDNNIVSDGVNGRALSPPGFPDIRVADDFVVRDANGWAVSDFHAAVIEDAAWVTSGRITITFYAAGGECPGAAIATRAVPVERSATGRQHFGRDEYEYWATFPEVILPPGRYWVGHRDAAGSGVGTNYWMTSDGGEGADTIACFSLDAGATWNPEGGPEWDHAFKITGRVNCEPCKGDINGDCFVNFDDLLQVLSGWGPCPDPTSCNDPPQCPAATCGPAEECFCFMTFEGDRDCHLDFFCENPACPGGSGDCPAGWSCYVETCCAEPTCAPDEDLCINQVAPRPVTALSGPTAAGLQK